MSPARPVLALAVALLATACATKNTPAATLANPPSGGGGMSTDVTGQMKVDIQADNFSFSPASLIGSPGQRITLVVHNASGTLHNVTVKEQKVNSDVANGKTTLVAVTFPASGQLVFTCEYHAARGMAGTLTTSGAGAAAPSAAPSPRVTSGGGYGSSGY